MTCILISRAIGGIYVDVVVSEEHEAELEIARHPVEKGVEISDNAYRNAYKVTLESVIDSPRAVPSWQALLDLQQSSEPFDLVTGLKVYSNMLIKRLSATRDKEHARVLKFTAELEEVVIVASEEAPATKSDSAKKTTARGAVTARPAENVPPRTNSILDAARGARSP